MIARERIHLFSIREISGAIADHHGSHDAVSVVGKHLSKGLNLQRDAFFRVILKKVIEEAGSLAHARSRSEFLAEYADLMVVLDALTAHLELSEADIKTAITENVKAKGLYKNRHFLEWSEDAGYKSNETPQGLT